MQFIPSHLKDSCCCVVKPHCLGDAKHRVVGEEGEEVKQTGEVGTSKAEHQSYFSLLFCFGKEAGHCPVDSEQCLWRPFGPFDFVIRGLGLGSVRCVRWVSF